MFADDATLVIVGPPNELNSLVEKLKEDLVNISNWMKFIRLTLNYEKIFLMLVCKPLTKLKITLPIVSINGHVLKIVNSVKILGLNIDKLDWSVHVKAVNRKCYATLGTIYPIRNIISYESRKILAVTSSFKTF
jgi:hypothetical protein